jgi:APA family basic amino acid/polyamine antiporter
MDRSPRFTGDFGPLCYLVCSHHTFSNMTNAESKNQLVRSLGLGFAISIVVANILGSGVYKKVAPMADTLQSPGWVLVAWILGGIITLMGALSNAEVAALLADTGGDYAYYKKLYSRFIAFMFGWSMFVVVQTASISSIGYVFAQSFRSLIPVSPMLENLQNVNLGGIFYPFQDFSTKLVAIILILALTWINTRAIKNSARISNLILWMVYIGIGSIIVFGLMSGKANLAQSFDFTTPADHPITISALFTAMLASFWAYQGWSSLGFIGGEIKEPHRNIPRGLAFGVGIVILIYLLTNAIYLAVLPIQQLRDINAAGDQIAAVEVVRAFWGNGGGIFMGALILITTLGCTHATIYGSARTYFAMAKEKLFFSKMDRLNSHHVPAKVIWVQGIWACLLVFSGTFDQLTDMIVFAIFFYYGLTTFGVFILRRRMPDAYRAYKMWGYPVIPAFFILFCIGLIINTIITQPREAIFGLILMLTGVPFWLWFKRRAMEPESPAAENHN